MREESNKQIIRQVFEEAFNHKNIELIDILFSLHFIDQSTPDQPTGPQGVKEYFAQVHTIFPDMQVTIDDLIAEGEKVVVRTRWSGTHMDKLADVEPTGKQVTRTMIQIFRVVDGKILEEWNEGSDLLQ
jgi:predicted ester cyclase